MSDCQQKYIAIAVISQIRHRFTPQFQKYFTWVSAEVKKTGYQPVFFYVGSDTQENINRVVPFDILNDKIHNAFYSDDAEFNELEELFTDEKAIRYFKECNEHPDKELFTANYYKNKTVLSPGGINKPMPAWCVLTKRLIAFNMINEYCKSHNIVFSYLFRLRSDTLTNVCSTVIQSHIHANLPTMCHDNFAFIPQEHIERYLTNIHHILMTGIHRSENPGIPCMVDTFISNNIPTAGTAWGSRGKYRDVMNKAAGYVKRITNRTSETLVRKKKNSETLCIMDEATKRLKWAHCDINIADEFGPFDILPHIKNISHTLEFEY